MEVNLVDSDEACLDDWMRLYQILVDRHELKGLKAFSRPAFAVQFKVPGLMIFRASRNGRTVGMHLWYLQSGVAYSHLAAFDREGYLLCAAYALHWLAIDEFKRNHGSELRWIDLGAGAGATEKRSDGLSTFKRGWATSEKVKYFCGSIFDQEAYESLNMRIRSDSNYFPLYRVGELS